MTINSFAQEVQLVCMTALAGLLLYTLWLSRYRGLDAHVTVRWAFVQCVAILAILLWRLLPIFEFTSRLHDRQLLLLTAVLVFAFVNFLILDLLVRVARQSVQIKKLTQELAIQRMRLDSVVSPEASAVLGDTAVRAGIVNRRAGKSHGVSLSVVLQAALAIWLLAAVVLNGLLVDEPLAKRIVYQIAPALRWEATLKPLLTATYLH